MESSRETYYVGANIGALTVKVVALKGEEPVGFWAKAHQGRPRELLDELLSSEAIGPDRYIGVCGHLGHSYLLSMPILTCEGDGYTVPPVFLRQVEVHIQQVLDAFASAGSASLPDVGHEVGEMIPV